MYLSNFAQLILEICKEEEITCTPLSDYWAFQLKKGEVETFLYGYQFALNTAAAHSICSDKSTASEIMTLHQIPNVLHICCMSPVTMEYAPSSGNWDKIIELFQAHGSLVLKNNHGTGGDLVYHARTKLELEHAAQFIFARAHSMAVSPYYTIDNEYRIIVLNGEVKLVYSKIRPHLTGDGTSTVLELYTKALHQKQLRPGTLDHEKEADFSRILKEGEIYPLHWKHNLGQGASAQLVTEKKYLKDLGDLARMAAEALHICFASIDIIETNGKFMVLEVNSGVMMEYFAADGGKNRALAKEIYREAILLSF